MGIIIGSMTQVDFDVVTCVISVSWSTSSNIERFYCIGDWDPFLFITKPTQSLNITLYAPGPQHYSTLESRSCDTTNSIKADVVADGCDGGGGVSGTWFVSSYSYSKDSSVVPGQESWSMVRWLSGEGIGVPTVILRGIAEGSGSIGSGVSFAVGGYTVLANSGGVSANGIGRSDTVTQGQVSGVGAGVGVGGGTGVGSASIPYIPMYI